MRIHVKFKPLHFACILVVLAIAIAAVVLNALTLAEVAGFVNYGPALTVVSLCCSVAIALLALAMIFLSFYSFKDGYLFSCIALFGDKVKYPDMLELRLNSTTNTLFVLYKSKKKSLRATKLSKSSSDTADSGFDDEEDNLDNMQNISITAFWVKSEKNDEIIAFLKKKNPDIVIEIFDEEEKQPKTK